MSKDEKAPPRGRGQHTEIPILPPDDPIFTRGPIVGGRRIAEEHGAIDRGALPHDHWIYQQGPMIFGRPARKKEDS
jgi:hypothetical protein